MSRDERRPDRLAALERWQSSELDDARLTMGRLNAIAADKQADVERIEDDIARLHSLARAQAADLSALDADALLRMNEFNAYQLQQLKNARDSHEQAAQRADDAQRDVLQRFESLSVVQRLIERRQEMAGQEQQRQAQKQLDEGALTRGPHARIEINTSEDSSHGS